MQLKDKESVRTEQSVRNEPSDATSPRGAEHEAVTFLTYRGGVWTVPKNNFSAH